MKKKALALTLVTILCLSLLPAAALADGDFTVEYGVLTRYNGSGGAVTIPGGITEIGESAFDSCADLTSVIIPSGVTKIGRYAFSDCAGLTSITIPAGVTEIGAGAFSGCASLTSVTIPDGITEISWSTFSGCTSLTSVAIPTSVNRIGFGAFEKTPWLENQGDDMVIVNEILLAYHGNGGDVTIPGGVATIGEGAFYQCETLTGVTIPNGVTVIGRCAFSSCEGLTNVTIGDDVTVIGSQAFSYCTGLTGIDIPVGVTRIGSGAFSGCTGLTSISIPDGVTAIEGYTFMNCDGLTSVDIPDSVTKIGAFEFMSCTGLTSITIPDSVNEIGATAFSGCSGLTSVVIPAGVTEIKIKTFSGCSGLTSVTIPADVTAIEENAFAYCTGLTDVYYGGTEEQWNAIDIWSLNENLTNATIHYNSGGTGIENPPVPSNTAYATTQEVLIDGTPVRFETYGLKDEKGNITNYIKLRDLASRLNGTNAQFSVGWTGDGDPTGIIAVTSGGSYQNNGSEMSTPFSGDRPYGTGPSKLMVSGKVVDVEAILLKDDNGGGYTYFKLRDLGRALNFNVSWVSGTGIVINTDQPYSDAS